MAIRTALFLILSAVVAIGGAYGATLALGAAPAFAAYALAYGIGASTTGMFILGAVRAGRLAPSLVVAFTIVFVVVIGAFWLALGMPAAEGAGGPLLLGLPRRTAIVLYGVGLVPMFLLPVAYALSFDKGILSEDDIARVRAAHQRMQEEGRR